MQSSCNARGSLDRPRFPLMFPLVAAALILNLFDAMFTVFHVSAGAATEANPLMAQVLANSPVLFVLTKSALVSLGLLLLWRLRNRATAVAGVFITVATYLSINAYHLHALVNA